MVCPNCGQSISENTYYCRHCGRPLSQKRERPRRHWQLAAVLGALLLVIAGVFTVEPLRSLFAPPERLDRLVQGAETVTNLVEEVVEEAIVPTSSATMAAGETSTPIMPTQTPLPSQTPLPPSATATRVPSPTPTQTPLPSPTATPTPISSQLVFQSNRDGDFEIFIMDVAGAGQRQLTHNNADDMYPSASPDGQSIAFQSNRDGNWEIYVMDVDGMDQRRLTANAGTDRLVNWSPDSRQLVFASDQGGDYDLYLMGADGDNLQQLTDTSDLQEGHVSWSVDDKLVYNAGTQNGSSWEIYVMNLDGSGNRQLTSNRVSDWSPEWSPDGRSFVFLSEVNGNDPALFLMDADGSNQRQIYNSDNYEWGARWSADGRIIFTVEIDGVSNMYLMNTDGREAVRLATQASYPSWIR